MNTGVKGPFSGLIRRILCEIGPSQNSPEIQARSTCCLGAFTLQVLGSCQDAAMARDSDSMATGGMMGFTEEPVCSSDKSTHAIARFGAARRIDGTGNNFFGA